MNLIFLTIQKENLNFRRNYKANINFELFEKFVIVGNRLKNSSSIVSYARQKVLVDLTEYFIHFLKNLQKIYFQSYLKHLTMQLIYIKRKKKSNWFDIILKTKTTKTSKIPKVTKIATPFNNFIIYFQFTRHKKKNKNKTVKLYIFKLCNILNFFYFF